jgi:hypothetical protein
MDFIERIFGISPDGGDGSFELLLLLMPIVAIVAMACWRRRRLFLGQFGPLRSCVSASQSRRLISTTVKHQL